MTLKTFDSCIEKQGLRYYMERSEEEFFCQITLTVFFALGAVGGLFFEE
jgi:hypothetical protein